MHVLSKPFPKISNKIQSSNIAWLSKGQETHTHIQNPPVDATILCFQYLISYCDEKGGNKEGMRIIVLI